MDKIARQTADLTDENIARVAELFPNVVTEVEGEDGETHRAIDFDALREQLGDVAEGGRERYQFTWPGKRAARAEARRPCDKTFRPQRGKSKDWDNTQNLYIEGDNLEALKLLRNTYAGKIKMIYIDPPYNTGGDLVYRDSYKVNQAEEQGRSGDFDETGMRMERNLDTDGRFHTNWCSMIYPRLLLARDLLTQDGAIFISIDENEVGNLRKIADEVFGQRNLIAEFIWAAGRKNDSKYVSVSHEYIVCYCRSIETLKENGVEWRERKQGLDSIYAQYDKLKAKLGDDYDSISKGLKSWYRSLPANDPAKNHKHYSNVDQKGIYFSGDISWPGGGGPKYDVKHPVTGLSVKIPSSGWRYPQAKLMEMIADERVEFGLDEKRSHA